MSVRKRPNSQFWQYRFKERGVPWSGSTRETDRGKALKFEAVLRSKVIRGELRREMLDLPTLAVFSATFLAYVRDTQDLSANTKRCYRNGWRLLGGTKVAGMKLDLIGTHDASVLKFPGSGSNANQALRTLRVMLSFAASKGLLKSAPKIGLRKEQKRKAVLTDPWQEDLLLDLAPANLRDFMLVILKAGMRPEEVARMRWEHVLWGQAQIRVDEGKTDSAERFTVLTAALADAMRERKRGSKSEWVFPSPRKSESGHVVPTSVSRGFGRLLKLAAGECKRRGLPTEWLDGLVLYSLRHTFATNFQEASGGDRAKLAKVLGHSSMAIGERYVHPSTGDAADVMDAWEAERRKVVKMGRRA